MKKEQPPKVYKGGFSMREHHFIYVNTNISNARMNIPKAIKSLKSYVFRQGKGNLIVISLDLYYTYSKSFQKGVIGL